MFYLSLTCYYFCWIISESVADIITLYSYMLHCIFPKTKDTLDWRLSVGQIQPLVCYYTALELIRVFTFLKGCKEQKQQRICNRDRMCPSTPKIFRSKIFTPKIFIVCQPLFCKTAVQSSNSGNSMIKYSHHILVQSIFKFYQWYFIVLSQKNQSLPVVKAAKPNFTQELLQ